MKYILLTLMLVAGTAWAEPINTMRGSITQTAEFSTVTGGPMPRLDLLYRPTEPFVLPSDADTAFYCPECDAVYVHMNTCMYCPNTHSHCNDSKQTDPVTIKEVKRKWAEARKAERELLDKRVREILEGGKP